AKRSGRHRDTEEGLREPGKRRSWATVVPTTDPPPSGSGRLPHRRGRWPRRRRERRGPPAPRRWGGWQGQRTANGARNAWSRESPRLGLWCPEPPRLRLWCPVGIVATPMNARCPSPDTGSPLDPGPPGSADDRPTRRHRKLPQRGTRRTGFRSRRTLAKEKRITFPVTSRYVCSYVCSALFAGPPASLLRQAGPDVVGADDPGDVLHQDPRARDVGARVQHHHHRHPLGGQVVGVDHVAHDVAVVADPAVLVFERQPVQRAVAFRGRRQELLLLPLHGGRDQLAGGEVARPHTHVVERRDHVAR